MKRSVKTLLLVLALVGAFTMGVHAAGTLEEIKAYLNYGVTIRYDNEVQICKDANGKRVYPITYKGTTYLPVRAVGNMMGLPVDWDAASQTVLLGAKADGTDLIETYKPYTDYVESKGISGCNTVFVQSSAGQNEAVGGVTLSHWLHLRNGGVAISGADGMSKAEPLASFKIGGKYKTLTFQAYTNEDTTLTVKGDGDAVLATFQLKGGETPQSFTVDLKNTDQLTFHRAAAGYAAALEPRFVETYIFDAMLK